MSRRTTQIRNEVQTIQFSSFKAKRTEIVGQLQENSFIIYRIPNGLLLGLLFAYFTKKSPETFNQNETNIINLQQVPRQFALYQHEQTIICLLNIISNKMTVQKMASELLNSYPITEFVLNFYVRSLVAKQIQMMKNGTHRTHPQVNQLMGNEEEIISDYTSEIRGNLLNIAAQCLDVYLNINYGPDGQLTESYGNLKSGIKLEVSFSPQQNYIFNLVNPPSTNATNSRPQTPRGCSRDSYSRNNGHSPSANKNAEDYRNVPESRSATKQTLTNVCQGCKKRAMFCDCNKQNSKGFPYKLNLNSSYSNISPLNSLRSNFDSQSYIPNVHKENITETQKKCKCNRSYCRYCKLG